MSPSCGDSSRRSGFSELEQCSHGLPRGAAVRLERNARTFPANSVRTRSAEWVGGHPAAIAKQTSPVSEYSESRLEVIDAKFRRNCEEFRKLNPEDEDGRDRSPEHELHNLAVQVRASPDHGIGDTIRSRRHPIKRPRSLHRSVATA